MTTLPPITAADLRAPLAWVEALPDDALRVWLRTVLRARLPLPFRLAPATRLAPGLARALDAGSPSLHDALREAIPTLLAERRPEREPEALDDLIILAGMLRCPGAERPLRRLLEGGLMDRDNGIPLAQRALATLAGFGLTPRLVPLFEDALQRRETAAIAWRALVTYDLEVGAQALPALTRVFAHERPRLELLLRSVLAELPTDSRRLLLLDHVVWQGDAQHLGDCLEALYAAGLIWFAPGHDTFPVYWQHGSQARPVGDLATRRPQRGAAPVELDFDRYLVLEDLSFDQNRGLVSLDGMLG